MANCSWCSKDIGEVKNRDDLCGFCDKRYWVKKNFSDPERGYLHKDDPSDEEYRALVHMNTCREAQKVMRKRISRMKEIIQAQWTSEQEQRRAVFKKKVTYSLLKFTTFRNQNCTYLRGRH